jgi:hypothetical protein
MFVYVRFGGYGIGISTRGAILIIEDYKSIYTGADSEQGENDQVSIGGQTDYKVEALRQGHQRFSVIFKSNFVHVASAECAI